MRLKGKVAFVTGATSGIGRAIAQGLAGEGAAVAVNGTDAGRAGEVVQAIRAAGGVAEACLGSVADAETIGEAIRGAATRFGRLDILVNNAGVLSSAPVLDLAPAELQRIFQVNVFGLVYASQAAARIMVAQGTGGAILNISSLNASTPFRQTAHYSASKAAVSNLTRSMALELGAHRIRVNELCPASVETAMNRKSMRDPESRRVRLDVTPLRRIGQPEELAGAAVFLCSDEAGWITGASLAADGGLGLAPPLGASVSRY
jgi:NAD(P)-dependent dehydrogenase (short-subunit alcohol dehydrogenase family)